MVDYAEFLFPTGLSVTKTNLSRVLFVGSCLTEHYLKAWKAMRPEVGFDFLLYNNLDQFPKEPPRPLADYDLQYLQIPLRSLLTDAVVSMTRFIEASFSKEVLDRACHMLEFMLDKALTYNRRSGILTVVSNFVVPQGRAAASLRDRYTSRDISWLVERLNERLAEIVNDYKNVYVADIECIASTIGKGSFLDDTIAFYSHGSLIFPDWSGHENNPAWTNPEPGRIEAVPPINDILPLTTYKFIEAVFAQIDAIYRIVNQIDQVKVVIFDLDNTLWRGQIGDHYGPGSQWPYSDGWPLGVWEAIHHLRARGIMVAICSKNDPALVSERWANAVNPPFLALSDFVSVQINWNTKAENIAIILEQLNLTAKSAVLVDDNPVERAACMAAHSGLRTIGSNPFMTRRTLMWAPETQVAMLTNESSRRETMIRAQIDRSAQSQGQSREAFLKGLGTTVDLINIHSETQNEYSRTIELINKTNQFNTTGRRWRNVELNSFLSEGGKIYAFRVKDRFADYGLVGIVLIMNEEFLQFAMSCRVLGMDIETAVLGRLVDMMRTKRPEAAIIGKIVETDSNLPCRDLFVKAGFRHMPGQPGGYSIEFNTPIPKFEHVTFSDPT